MTKHHRVRGIAIPCASLLFAARRVGTLLGLLATLAGCANLVRVGSIAEAEKHYAKGECKIAVEKLDAGLAYGTPPPDFKAQVSFLKALCFETMERESEAVELYRYVSDQFPTNPYAYQARGRLRMLGETP